MEERSSMGFRLGVLTAVVVACSLLGDSFLYIGLPLQFKTLELSLVSVGILLSVNRFVRFFSNTWAGYIYRRYGIKLPLVAAICVGTMATLSYSLTSGFLPFLLARIIWGVAWSFLRLPGYLFVAATSSERRGKMMGLYQSISVIGSLCGTLVGGLLLDLWGFRSTVLFLTCGSAIGIPVALSLKDAERLPLSEPRISAPIDLKLIFGGFKMLGVGLGTTMNNLLLGSVLTSTLALYLLELVGEGVSVLGVTLGIATLSGFLVATQRMSRIAAGSLLGWMSDILGRQRTVAILLTGGIASMAILGLSYSISVIVLAVLLAFISSTALGVVLATEASDLAADQDEGREYVISSYVNWVDLGSAMGPLIAYVLRLGITFRTIYLGASIILLAVAIFHHYAPQMVKDREKLALARIFSVGDSAHSE